MIKKIKYNTYLLSRDEGVIYTDIDPLKKDLKILNQLKKELEEKEHEIRHLKEKQMLSHQEYEHLKTILKSHKEYKVKYVTKMIDYLTDNNDLLFITYIDDKYSQMYSSYFIKKGTYKNMKMGKKYTLKELGIDYE